MRNLILLFFVIVISNCFGQKIDTTIYKVTHKDTIIYNVIKKDTIVEKVKEKKEFNFADNWGIGPYAGFDYTLSKPYGNGFSASFGFGVSYYIWRLKLPVVNKRKKHIAD